MSEPRERILSSSRVTVVARLLESHRGDGAYDTFRGDERVVGERDPSRIPLYESIGFFFADVQELIIDHGDGETEVFLGERLKNRSPIYWMPTSIIGTSEELLKRFPDEANLIRAASSKFEEGCDRLVRVEILLEEDDEDDDGEEAPGPMYLQCHAHDQVLPDDHGIDVELSGVMLN